MAQQFDGLAAKTLKFIPTSQPPQSGIYADESGVVSIVGGVAADAFVATGAGVNVQTGTSYTLVKGDNGKTVTLNNASAIALTVPSGLPPCFACVLVQLGAGQVTVTPAGTTLRSVGGALKLSAQYAQAAVINVATNVYSVGGSLST